MKEFELEDINVEHSQLLLFLFHSMKLLQRKHVLLMISQTLVNVSNTVLTVMKDHQIHCLGRLVHFFEYMIKNLYDAPGFLVEQIDTNLFKSSMSLIHKRDKDNNVDEVSKLYFGCKDVDDNYHKFTESSIFATTMRPRFYYLLNVDNYSTKDVPKLDGMSYKGSQGITYCPKIINPKITCLKINCRNINCPNINCPKIHSAPVKPNSMCIKNFPHWGMG